MNLGYSFWGHTGDRLSEQTKNSPDGCAWYASSIVEELSDRGHSIYRMMPNRDQDDVLAYGVDCFKAFCTDKRIKAYDKLIPVDLNTLPELDILLLEWRFPIPGRNTLDLQDTPNFQPDYLIQTKLLNHYLTKTNTKIVIFDLDYKLDEQDEHWLSIWSDRVTVFETSIKPKDALLKRVSVNIPFWMTENIVTSIPSKYKKIVYIGNRYERDDPIEKYLIPFSKKYPFTVWLYGNWRNYADKYDELYEKLKWRDIQYHNRIGHNDFAKVYGDSVCCPLLAKKEYFDNGFITARIQECLYFGSIPVGFSEHNGINKYLPEELIVSNNNTLENIVNKLEQLSIPERFDYRFKLWDRLSFMDIKYFVNSLLSV